MKLSGARRASIKKLVAVPTTNNNNLFYDIDERVQPVVSVSLCLGKLFMLVLKVLLRLSEFSLKSRRFADNIEDPDKALFELAHPLLGLVHVFGKHFLPLNHELRHLLKLFIGHCYSLSINLSQHNIQRPDDRDHVRNQMSETEFLKRLQ